MNPEDPQIKGVSEVEHDGMPDKGHEEQLNHAGSQKSE